MMAKRKKKPGKSARHGNLPAPYTKYQKTPFPYGEGYKSNHLVGGVLYRNGKPFRHKSDELNIYNAAETRRIAAE